MLDFAVEFGPAPEGMHLWDQYFDFRSGLAKVVNLKIDLVETVGIRSKGLRVAIEWEKVAVH